ncbi:MAG: heme ABC transporter permease [Gammaproteobacteria bacterium]|jgi:heme exporter protein C|nr:heme ABC transporter permease [Gammaproteobacteria bacterium]
MTENPSIWQRCKVWFHRWGSPAWFYRTSGYIIPWLWGLFFILALPGLYLGLFVAPADYLQGDSYRIIYIHVPSAWMSMMIFALMAAFGLIGMVWRIRIAETMAICSAPIGAAFTLIALLTGSLWGKPTWGTYWQWDARMTSELVLLFLYIGVMALYQSIDEPRKAARSASLLALVGLVNLPIIHYSVQWWNTLHQGSTIKLDIGESSMDTSMLIPLLLVVAASKFYYAAVLLSRSRGLLLQQDQHKRWPQELWHSNKADPT